jgi:hypothetical protein
MLWIVPSFQKQCTHLHIIVTEEKEKEFPCVMHLRCECPNKMFCKILSIMLTLLILVDPCIVDYSVEIPTRSSFIIEFIIPKFFLKAQHISSGTPLIIRSSKLYLQPLVYMPIWWPVVAKAEWAPYGHINQRLQIQFRASDNERCTARNMLSL